MCNLFPAAIRNDRVSTCVIWICCVHFAMRIIPATFYPLFSPLKPRVVLNCHVSFLFFFSEDDHTWMCIQGGMRDRVIWVSASSLTSCVGLETSWFGGEEEKSKMEHSFLSVCLRQVLHGQEGFRCLVLFQPRPPTVLLPFPHGCPSRCPFETPHLPHHRDNKNTLTLMMYP